MSDADPCEEQVLTKIVDPRFEITYALSLYHQQLFHQQRGSFIDLFDYVVDHDPALADLPLSERLVCPFDSIDAVELCSGLNEI